MAVDISILAKEESKAFQVFKISPPAKAALMSLNDGFCPLAIAALNALLMASKAPAASLEPAVEVTSKAFLKVLNNAKGLTSPERNLAAQAEGLSGVHEGSP